MTIFSLVEISFDKSHWWFSFLYFEIWDKQYVGFHIEYDQGVWKWDFLGLWNLVRWLRDK